MAIQTSTNFEKNLAHLLKEQGVKSAVCKHSGIRVQYLCAILAGERTPSVKLAAFITKAIEHVSGDYCSLDELLNYSSRQFKNKRRPITLRKSKE